MSARTKAPKGKPETWTSAGKVEVESTPEGVLIRLRFPDGDEAGVEVSSDMAIDVAATMMFCALRHCADPDAATDRFMKHMQERGEQLTRSMNPARRPS